MNKCPTELQMACLADGTLATEDQSWIIAHLAECGECGQVWAELEELNALQQQECLPAVSAGERLAVLRRITALATEPAQGEAVRKHNPISAFFSGLIDARTAMRALLAEPLLSGERGCPIPNGGSDGWSMHLCAIRCEAIILKDAGIAVDEEALVQEAVAQGWFVPDGGMPLTHLGKLLSAHGLQVERRVHANVDMIRGALDTGHMVMVAVDAGELLKRGRLARWLERIEDYVARIPDHCVLVTGVCDGDGGSEVMVRDTGSLDRSLSIPERVFYDAWEDSDFFLLTARRDAE